MPSKRDAALRAFLKGRARATEGPLFRWLWDHHAEVAEGLHRHRTGWATVVEWVEAAGVTGKLGGRPSRSALIKVWARVLREREALTAARAAQPRRTPPNRSPRRASPELLAAIAAAKPVAPFAPTTPIPDVPTPRDPTPAEMIEQVRRRLAGR